VIQSDTTGLPVANFTPGERGGRGEPANKGRVSAEAASPKLCVVVVALAQGSHLTRCLAALRHQAAAPAMEVIVPHDDHLPDVDALREIFPAVNFLHLPGRHTYAELRAAALRASRGPLVAITEDQCIPPERWCANVVQAHANPAAAIGGPVEKLEPDRPLNWALYLRELGTYMPPLNEGPRAALTDCNVSYKRAALDDIADVWAASFHEPQVHAALQARGHTLWLSPALLTFQQRSLRFGSALAERYAFGRLYASLRAATLSPSKRLGMIVASPFLPALLLVRVVVGVLRKRRHVMACITAFPYLVLFAAVWAWGEFLGYLTGHPADSR